MTEDIHALLLAHEEDLATMLRPIIRTVRDEVEQHFPDATTREQLQLGAALLRMILVSIEREML